MQETAVTRKTTATRSRELTSSVFREPSLIQKNKSRSLKNSLLLSMAIGLVAIGAWCVLRSQGCGETWVAWAAAMVVLFACIPPLWFNCVMNAGPIMQLYVTSWRFGILLFGVALGYWISQPTRNYFYGSLMACYFGALPLESWLVARLVRQIDDVQQ